MNKGIYWLASYPKSGNTWFRTFLKNLLNDGKEPVSINDLSTGEIGSSRNWLDGVLGFDSADLCQCEIDQLRPRTYDWTAEQSEEYRYHKIHDACWQLDSGQWLVSAEATNGALYFVRNPLDVAISYANHCHSGIDKAISRMANPEHCFCKNKHGSLTNQTEQRLLTWSQHVTSWVDNPVIDTHVMRYEDMKHKPQQTFTQAVNYLKLPNDSERIAKALSFSDFKALQQQEVDNKFRERPPNIERFFRKGIAGDWQQTLTKKQIDQVIKDHHEVMERFGYLDSQGIPQVM
ncbi:sulfotransferase [Leucothrix pacifica]|uniref:Sulfotransferase n=2 Tax=Leucothrix pacifica TaxID=1247513 RepID=A0A317C3S1_9GAMM|nr:sulfotransferase [Leucothrix pacifica]